MITANEIVDALGEETVRELGNNLITEVSQNEDVKAIIGGVVFGASLCRLVPFSAPVCLAIGVGIAAFSIATRERTQNEEIVSE